MIHDLIKGGMFPRVSKRLKDVRSPFLNRFKILNDLVHCLLLFGACLGLLSFDLRLAQAGPLAPGEAVHSFETEPGLRVELAAAEPLVSDPCAICWDERGRMFVAENRGYPTGGPGGSAAGTIAMLEDKDGDGRYENRTDFASGLTFPNGLMPWRGGLIVTCAPDVLYFKDTDGDGKADSREILLTGFATNQSTQLRVNKPMLALDGWVYLASGLSGGKITSPKRPRDQPLELKGDLRFKPDTGECEHIDGKSQFGQSFDDFGRRFGVFNRVQVQHFVLPSRYVERNPHLASPGVMQNCPELFGNPFLRGGGGAARIYPVSANITTADSHAGTFSAACAIHLWRGGALSAEYVGHAFTCDPTGNLVHHDRLEPAGATFAASRIGENIEFLRSRDDWFRPVYLDTGPDGALYVCDMYRKVIEHPEYLPVEVRKRTDFESGKGMGRIWRVIGAHESRGQSPVRDASTRALVDELQSLNSWRRDTAFRLLIERADPQAAEFLQSGLDSLDSEATLSSRLYLLSSLGALNEAQLLFALKSRSAGVREVALKLAEPKLPSLTTLHARVFRLATDLDPRVRFQCALVLGEMLRSPAANTEALSALAGIATRDVADKWTRAAVLSSAAGHERALLALVLREASTDNVQISALLTDLGRLLFRSVPDEQHPALVREMLFSPASDFDHLAALLAGFAEARPERLLSLIQRADSAASKRLQELFQKSMDLADDTTSALPRRLLATKLLASANGPESTAVLLRRLEPGEPFDLHAPAVRALTQPGNASGVRELLVTQRWTAFTPGIRAAILGELLSRPEHQPALLDALESGAVSLSGLDSSRRELLRKSKNDAVRKRAEKLFASATSGDRRQAFENAKACLKLKSVAASGREVFRRLCTSCHRLDREGVAVGPDLFDIRNQSKEAILLHIVLPEQEVAPNFANYICETSNGRVFSGLIAAEAAGSVTLRRAQGLEETIFRGEIASLTASQAPLMPQELEKGMTAQELADLLAYLKGEAD
jgi:putative membrane-bound dehydrogenase-like protein